MRTILLYSTLIAAAIAPAFIYGQAETSSSGELAKKVEEHGSWKSEALDKVDGEIKRLAADEKELSGKRAELNGRRHELDAEENKMGMETGLAGKNEALMVAEKDLKAEANIYAEKRATVQAMEGEINRIKTDFEREHGILGKRDEINQEQKELDKEERHLNDRLRELREAKRKLEHMDKDHQFDLEGVLTK